MVVRRDPITRGSFAAAVVLTVLVAGCAALPDPPARAAEQALPAATEAPLARLAEASLPADRPGDSGFRLIFPGESAFNTRIALVRRATRSIDLQVYQFAGDATGRGLLRELRDAAGRGVRVRLLIDDLQAGGTDALLIGLAAHANVQVRLFNPLPVREGSVTQRLLGSLHEFRRINRRMHNKLFIADASFAIFGGRNVADAYFMNDPQANFLDLDVLAAGPVVAQLATIFDGFWNAPQAYPIDALAGPPGSAEATWQRFDAMVEDGTVRLGERQHDWFGRPTLFFQLREGRLTLDTGSAQVLADRPEKAAEQDGEPRGPTVAAQALELLASARQEALVMSPYYIPGARGLQVMRELGEGKVQVTLLTNSFGATDEPLAYAGYERYRLDLLRFGVRIYELSPTLARDSGRVAYFGDTIGRLHTKMLAIDHRWLFVGSLNLDPRSAFTNTEIGVVIDSPALVRQVGFVFRRATASGAFRLRLDGDRIEWVATDAQGHETVHADEPHDDPWLHLKLRLLQPFVPEDLL